MNINLVGGWTASQYQTQNGSEQGFTFLDPQGNAMIDANAPKYGYSNNNQQFDGQYKNPSDRSNDKAELTKHILDQIF